MLNILIVEDEPLLAATLRHLIERNPRFQVTAIADDLPSVLEAIEDRRPDLALVDLQLANGSSGYSVAVRLHDRGIACLFTTGKPPGFPVPDLAIGCLHKPFEEDDLVRALTAAEDMLRGRQTLVLRPNLPERLQIYEAEEAVEGEPRSGWLPAVPTAKPSLRQRLSGWLAPH